MRQIMANWLRRLLMPKSETEKAMERFDTNTEMLGIALDLVNDLHGIMGHTFGAAEMQAIQNRLENAYQLGRGKS